MSKDGGYFDLNDEDPINEIQEINKEENRISLSKNGGFFDLNDDDPTNEIQEIRKDENNRIFLSKDGGYFDLNDEDSTNEIQEIAFSDGVISLSKNNSSVSIEPYIWEKCINEINKLKSMLKSYGIVQPDTLNGIDSDGLLYNGYYSVSTDKKIQFSCGAYIDAGFVKNQFETSTSLSEDVIEDGWRLLSRSEWDYIVNSRPNAAQLHFWAQINGKFGLVLLPDGLTNISGITYGADGYNRNIISEDYWQSLQTLGAVFLSSIYTELTPQANNYNSRGAYYVGYGTSNIYAYIRLCDGLVKTGVNSKYTAIRASDGSSVITTLTFFESLVTENGTSGICRYVKDVK